MMKKKILSLCMVAIMLNFSVESYAYSLNNIQLATNSDSISTPSEGGDTPSGDGGAEQPPSAPPNGSNNGESSAQPPSSSGGSTGTGGAGSSTTTPNTPLENKGGSNSVELDGGIGEWGPDKDKNLPNFNGTEKTDVDNALQEGQYFTISATVPLNMEFLIKNENENGSSPNGKFITPYYKVINNGSHKLKVHFESFEYATSSTTKTSGLITEKLEKLYVVDNPIPKNNMVEMKLNLTYDRPSNSYLKRIDLIPTNSPTITSRLLKSSNSVEQVLGLLDPNEQARLYYGSDLWESPKSENVTKGVEANFNLKLAFSIDGKTTETNQPSGSTPDTSPSQPPSAPTPSQPPNGTTPGDTSQSSPGSSTQGQQPNGDTSSETQNPAGNGQQGQRN